MTGIVVWLIAPGEVYGQHCCHYNYSGRSSNSYYPPRPTQEQLQQQQQQAERERETQAERERKQKELEQVLEKAKKQANSVETQALMTIAQQLAASLAMMDPGSEPTGSNGTSLQSLKSIGFFNSSPTSPPAWAFEDKLPNTWKDEQGNEYLLEFGSAQERQAYIEEMKANRERWNNDWKRQEAVQAEWERMERKAMKDFQEGSYRYEENPQMHGWSAQEKARYWTLKRQEVDEITRKSLEGTGYSLDKVKSDARDWADRYVANHLKDAMTIPSTKYPGQTQTQTEAERNLHHKYEKEVIQQGVDQEMGSRPGFGPGSEEFD